MVRKSDEHTVGFNTHPINFVTPSSEMPRNDRWERKHPCGALSLTNSSGPRADKPTCNFQANRTQIQITLQHADCLSEYLIHFLVPKTDRHLIWKNRYFYIDISHEIFLHYIILYISHSFSQYSVFHTYFDTHIFSHRS